MEDEYYKKLWAHMNTIECQAAFIIYDKYKRKMDLNIQQLVKSAQTISDARKEKGKTPNMDYIVQELGKLLK